MNKAHKQHHAEEKRKNAGLALRKKKQKHGYFQPMPTSPRANRDAWRRDRSLEQIESTVLLSQGDRIGTRDTRSYEYQLR